MAKKAAKTVLLNRAQMAQAAKTSLPTLTKWVEQGCPVAQRGGRGSPWGFDPEAVAAWRADRLAELQAETAARQDAIKELQGTLDLQESSGRPEDQLPFKAREEYYRAEQRRMEVDKRREFLCDTSDVHADYAATFNFLSDRLQSLPDYLERRHDLPPAAVADLVKAIDEWQDELARLLEEDDLNAAAA